MEQTNRIVIDATNAVLGRLASFAAKQLLLGKQVVIVNSEKAIVKGNKDSILKRYKSKISRGGTSQKGPYFPRKPEAILRRTIRGMLPYDKAKGREAFKNVRCYFSVPKEFEASNKVILSNKKLSKFLTLEQISKLI